MAKISGAPGVRTICMIADVFAIILGGLALLTAVFAMLDGSGNDAWMRTLLGMAVFLLALLLMVVNCIARAVCAPAGKQAGGTD